jgi:hypothetical protein
MFENVQFFRIVFKVCKKCYYDPKKCIHEKYQYGYKNAEFYADFKYVDVGFLFEISIKLCFFTPILIFFMKKLFCIIIALFANFKCNAKKLGIFRHFAISKKLFFCQYLSFSV